MKLTEDVGTIELLPMTRERMHALYRGFALDPAIFADMALYEKRKHYVYDPERVDRLFELRSEEPGSLAFAVVLNGTVIGEVGLRHFDAEAKECELSIHLQNDAVKGRGYGTQAERLAVAYAFDVLGAKRVFAEALMKNTRSQHVLEKLGFRYTGEADGFRQYLLENESGGPSGGRPDVSERRS